MLTACPKCHHMFVQPGANGACAAKTKMKDSPPPSQCSSPPQHHRVVEENLPRQCCPSVMTIHVPPCAMTSWTGGTVILQKGNSSAKLKSPEPSPSTPLSFVLPSTPTVILSSPSAEHEPWNFTLPLSGSHHSNPSTSSSTSSLSATCPSSRASHTSPQSEQDLQRLSTTLKRLSISGWYYEGLSWQESVPILMSTMPGTFLVRDSSDPRYLFSLSVQTSRGPTSVRIHYSNGHFRLDAETNLAPVLPQFDCVVKLIEYYVNITKDTLEHRKKRLRSKISQDQVWIDSTGDVYSQILLKKPLLKQREKFPTLRHLARLSINSLLKSGCYVPTSKLPVSLQEYLMEYPYIC